MQFQYSGGTPQQNDWAKEAVQSCNYPLNLNDALVTFQWVDQLPASDTNHPYMVTNVDGNGAFTVSIASWADDPTNPNNQGLRNPAQDIKQFYMESVVHELGHVVSISTFEGIPTKLQQMCALFWTTQASSGTGIRSGTTSDYQGATLAWGAQIREAVAEVFKCAFYTEPAALIFRNRTDWNIAPGQWADFLVLIEPIDLLQGIQWHMEEVGTQYSANAGDQGIGPFNFVTPFPAHSALASLNGGALGPIQGGAGSFALTVGGSSEYVASLSFELDLYRAGQLSDTIVVTFTAKYDGASTAVPQNILTVSVTHTHAGVADPTQSYTLPLQLWSTVTAGTIENFSVFWVPTTTALPVEAAYPFTDGNLNVDGNGLRGAILIGH